ncbi:GNAT family N-acetyltransferase [Demetria terragena]|uniref:GNAT family N-acetyltransferase n=1 Tax=Demetria terragena TaxID=63959 RepID=UPI0004783E66|nr:GNAT family N-acetyltransferase [Demetria terragena]
MPVNTPDLPSGWVLRTPTAADVDALIDLVRERELAVRGRSSVDPEAVASEVVGTGSWTRWHLVAVDESGTVGGWASVHDRAAGRTNVQLVVTPSRTREDQNAVATALLDWVVQQATEVAQARGASSTQLDASTVEGDSQLNDWYASAGLAHTRTWLQMTRPVTSEDADLPGPRDGVLVRRVARHEDGMPVADDLRGVHQVLEESFADHFNSYRESFAEFAQRLREDPGHRWDHWWLATIETDRGELLGGSVVSSVLPADASGTPGSYIDYIGVHRRARGRGVAKALLFTVIRDALERGRNRVGLEVDADSPTGADGLYLALGWTTSYRTQSWQRDLHVPQPSD